MSNTIYKDKIIPVFATFQTQTTTEPDGCFSDFDRQLSIFSMPVEGLGTAVLTLNAQAKPVVTDAAANIYYFAKEEDLVAAASRVITSVLGPECPDGNPAYSAKRLCAWNMASDLWPVLMTKWIRYHNACGGLPYRAMLAEPTLKWFQHPSLLSVDAIYRQGRPAQRGYCEVEPALALRYLLNTEDIQVLNDDMLLELCLSNPVLAKSLIEGRLQALRDVVELVHGEADANGT